MVQILTNEITFTEASQIEMKNNRNLLSDFIG